MTLPTPDQLRLLAEYLDGVEHPDIRHGDEVTDLLSAAAALIPWVIKTMRPDDVFAAHSNCHLILSALNTRVAEVLAAEQRDYIDLLEAGEVLLAAVDKGTRSLRENSDAVAALYDADDLAREGEYARPVLRTFRAKVFSAYDSNGDPQPNLIRQHYLVSNPPQRTTAEPRPNVGSNPNDPRDDSGMTDYHAIQDVAYGALKDVEDLGINPNDLITEVIQGTHRSERVHLTREQRPGVWGSLTYTTENDDGYISITLFATRRRVLLTGECHGADIEAETIGVSYPDDERIALVTDQFVAIVNKTHELFEEPTP